MIIIYNSWTIDYTKWWYAYKPFILPKGFRYTTPGPSDCVWMVPGTWEE